MSRAFVKEDGGDVPAMQFTLPAPGSRGYDRAAAFALLEGAAAGLTSLAEEATGYRWGEPHLRPHVEELLAAEEARPEAEQNARFITVARRYLRAG